MIGSLIAAAILSGLGLLLVILLIKMLDTFDLLPSPFTCMMGVVYSVVAGTAGVYANQHWQYWAILLIIYMTGIYQERKE